MDHWYAERWNGHEDVGGDNDLPIGATLPASVKRKPDAKDEQRDLIAKKGMEYENAFLEQLRQNGHDNAEFDAGAKEVAETTSAMRQKKDIIYQARLEDENCCRRTTASISTRSSTGNISAGC